jgi:hypothetical protein
VKIEMHKKIMSTAKILALSALGPLSISAVAQNTLTPIPFDNHPLVRKFKPCISPVGLTRDLPLADPSPKLEAPGHLYVLGDMGVIRDGYRHSLYVSGDGKQIYIVQVGGFAGTYKVFGPLDPSMDCSKKD